MKKFQSETKIETLTRKITPEEQGKYIEVEFNVPKNTEKLHVMMEIQHPKEASPSETVIDLGVRDSNQVRGWSGGARTEFHISQINATPGYLSGTLHQGNWAVILGSYRVGSGGCEVILTIEYTKETYRWLSGDLHTHSVHSDGTYTLEEKIEIAESLHLDFLALTDHNAASQNLARPRNTDLLLIPGMELTTNKGHLNLYGVDEPLSDFRVNSDAELAKRLEEARANGAKISLNHPYCRFTGWWWDWDFDYDFVEVWNGALTAEDNQKAVDWWHKQLVAGKKLVAIGGSDTHRPDPFTKHGTPTAWVYSNTLTQEGIFDAIHKGHVVLSYSPSGPFIELNCGKSMVGDICNQLDEKVNIKVNHVQFGDVIKVYSDKGLEQEEMISEGLTEIEYLKAIEERMFYRVEVWRYFPEVSKRLMAALSNPIYFK